MLVFTFTIASFKHINTINIRYVLQTVLIRFELMLLLQAHLSRHGKCGYTAVVFIIKPNVCLYSNQQASRAQNLAVSFLHIQKPKYCCCVDTTSLKQFL